MPSILKIDQSKRYYQIFFEDKEYRIACVRNQYWQIYCPMSDKFMESNQTNYEFINQL